MIELTDVTKSFGEGAATVRAVDGLSMRIPDGAFWAIMGPSGAGKSSVLHMIAALTPPDSGSIRVDGVEVTELDEQGASLLRRTKIGYVFQTFNLLPFLTAEENVAMPLVLDGEPEALVRERTAEALELVGMAHRAKHRPGEMSGGESQLVAVARALVIHPTIVLADEPTGSLDRSSGRQVMELIRDVNEKTGVTVLMVTHDPVFAAYADRVLRLVDGKLDQDTELD
jgi:putative ABC transport system ATP-binding protein